MLIHRQVTRFERSDWLEETGISFISYHYCVIVSVLVRQKNSVLVATIETVNADCLTTLCQNFYFIVWFN